MAYYFTNQISNEMVHCNPSAAQEPDFIAISSSRIPLATLCLFFALWLMFMIAGRSAMFRDPGTFWHVVVGENILSSRQLPREDTFSFTRSGQPWIADQWLAEIAMAAVHRAAGWEGLLTIAAAVLAGVYAFIAARLLRAGVHWLLTGAILALVLLAGSHQFHVRPLVLTLAGLTISFSLLVDVEAGRKSLQMVLAACAAVYHLDKLARRSSLRRG